MEELIDFDCCFEALKKASAILTILKSESCSVNEIKPIDQTEAAFERSLAAKKAQQAANEAKEAEAFRRQQDSQAALDKVEKIPPVSFDQGKPADVPPAEDKPATKTRGRRPKGSEDAPAEGKDTADTPPSADTPATPPAEVLFWDGGNSDHRKILIMILKEDHAWDNKSPDDLAFASLVKTELQNCQIDCTRQDLIRVKVKEIVEDLKAVLAQTKQANVKAPF
jgi:hypothetical protein